MSIRIAALLALCSLGFGCSLMNAGRFRVVDATDGHPLEGVHAAGTHATFDPGNPLGWLDPTFSTASYATSDAAGIVQFDNGHGGESGVTFEREGYEPCEIVASWPGYRPRNWLQRFKTFGWEDSATAVIKLQPCKRE